MPAYNESDGALQGFNRDTDSEAEQNRALIKELIDKQNELIQVMNDVASKYMKWSLAKDHFIQEVIAYSSQINSNTFNGTLSLQEAVHALDREILSLKKQDEELTKNLASQVVFVRPTVKEHTRSTSGRDVINVDIFIAGVGFVSGGLQIAAGVGMLGTGAGIIPGTLLIAHGINNVIENGYYLLRRESCTGPVRFIYEGIGDIFGLDSKDSDIIYTFVDVGLSLKGLFGYKLTEDAQRLYRYVSADLLWGMKKMGISLMGPGDIFIEIWGDMNTLAGQWRSNQ